MISFEISMPWYSYVGLVNFQDQSSYRKTAIRKLTRSPCHIQPMSKTDKMLIVCKTFSLIGKKFNK